MCCIIGGNIAETRISDDPAREVTSIDLLAEFDFDARRSKLHYAQGINDLDNDTDDGMEGKRIITRFSHTSFGEKVSSAWSW